MAIGVAPGVPRLDDFVIDSSHSATLQFLLDGIRPGTLHLDVGCGRGELMSQLQQLGVEIVGVEIDSHCVETCREQGLMVHQAPAETLPFENDSIDTILCSVVLPYTDDRDVIREWARVLKPGGVISLVTHGIGYGIDYLCYKKSLGHSVYGMRMLLNSASYRIIGRRLFGDTICQHSRALRSFYAQFGLELQQEEFVETRLGCPRFLCHRVVKPENDSSYSYRSVC